MSDIIGTKISQLPLGENLADDDLMLAVEDGTSKKVEIEYLKNRFVGDLTLADLGDDSTHRLVTDAEKTAWSGKQDALTFDNAPTSGSSNPVKSSGIYTALGTKANTSDLATVATSGSYNDLSNTPTIPSDADDISYDNTESGLTADDVQGAIDEVNGNIVDVEANPSGTATGELETIKVGSTIYNIVGGGGGSEPIYGEASGAIASFSDGSANPLADLKIAINPVQAGSGNPSPSNPRAISGRTGANVTRCGKNRFDSSLFSRNEVAGGNGEPFASTTRVMSNTILVNAGTYTYKNYNNLKMALYVYNEDGSYPATENEGTWGNSNPRTVTFTSTRLVRIVFAKSDDSTITLNEVGNVQFELGSTATSYEAYNGTTYPISWQTEAGTVYGGELDVTTGELTDEMFRISGTDITTLSLDSTNPTTTIFTFSYNANNFPKGKANTAISNRFSRSAPSGTVGRLVNTATQIYFIVPTNELQTVDVVGGKQWLADNPTDFIYEVDTPTTISLTPTQVSSLLGNNNIWADSGDSDVVYIRDVNLFLNQLDARVKALENA